MNNYLEELKAVYKNTDDQCVKDALIKVVASVMAHQKELDTPFDLSVMTSDY